MIFLSYEKIEYVEGHRIEKGDYLSQVYEPVSPELLFFQHSHS